MDKYLKKTDVSATTEVSVAHTTFDLTAWAENLSSSQRDHPSMASANTEPTSTKTEETTSNLNLSSASLLKPLSPGLKRDSKRSSIPVSSAGKSVGSEHPSAFNARADKDGSFSATAGSSTRTQTLHGVKQQEKLHTSNSNRSSLETQRSDHSLMTSPGTKKGQLSLSSSKGTSPLSLRSGGQRQQQDREDTSPEKKPLVRTASAPPLPSSSGEKHFGVSKPAVNQAAGKKIQKICFSDAKVSFFIRILRRSHHGYIFPQKCSEVFQSPLWK